MRYWKKLNPDGSTRTVESYSHSLDIEEAVEISEGEFNAYLASLPEPKPIPPPPVFSSPVGTGIAEKVEYIEQFLRELYPEEED